MIPYLILLIVVWAIAYVGRQSLSTGIRYASIGAVILLLVLFAGLRDRAVGTDTGNYVYWFEIVNSYADNWSTTEIGYRGLTALSATLSNNYAILLILIALLAVSSYITTIVKLNRQYDISIFLLVTSGCYTFFFNGARQGIAASICFLALPWLLKRRPIPYFLLVGTAALFHHTALIAGPLYFLARPTFSRMQIAVYVVGLFLAVELLPFFVHFVSENIDNKYANYADRSEGGGIITVIFLTIQGAALFLLRKIIDDREGCYTRLLNIYLIGLLPSIAAVLSNVNPSGILRLHLYFSQAGILLWPMLFENFRRTPLRDMFMFAFFLIGVTFFVLTTNRFGDLVPYQLNTDFVW